MDLTFLKWPVLILILGSLGFFLSTPGINYMYDKAVSRPTGVDSAQDASSEATLTRLGGLMLSTFRYKRAGEIFETAIKRYPDGKNNWYNWYQLARCYEKLERYAETVDILVMLRDKNADKQDDRVPSPQQLEPRIQKLVEVHGLPARPWTR